MSDEKAPIRNTEKTDAALVERSHIAVNGVRLAFEQRGSAGQTPLVLLHGFTGSSANWSALSPALAAAGLRVIAIDMLGHGQSDAPVDPARYAIERCQADIIAVLRALSIAPGEAILLGYSMGGRIALYSAFSGFFRALILESASPGLADATERARRRGGDEELARRIEREGVAAFVAYWEQLPLFTSQQALPRAQREALRRQRLNNCAEGLANSLRGVGTGTQPALHERLPALHIPALLIAGELDQKYCAIARDMAQLLPRARLALVPCAGHSVHLEQPGIFIKLVTDFCTGV